MKHAVSAWGRGIFSALLISLYLIPSIQAQDKKEMAKLEKKHAAFTGHKKFFKNKEWAMCKFSMVYKLTSALVAKDVDKEGIIKVRASSGAYAVLHGLREEDLQKTSNEVAALFMKRMKEEAGVNIATWNSFKSSANTEKIKAKEEDRELYSKSQGLAYAISYDGTPHYNSS